MATGLSTDDIIEELAAADYIVPADTNITSIDSDDEIEILPPKNDNIAASITPNIASDTSANTSTIPPTTSTATTTSNSTTSTAKPKPRRRKLTRSVIAHKPIQPTSANNKPEEVDEEYDFFSLSTHKKYKSDGKDDSTDVSAPNSQAKAERSSTIDDRNSTPSTGINEKSPNIKDSSVLVLSSASPSPAAKDAHDSGYVESSEEEVIPVPRKRAKIDSTGISPTITSISPGPSDKSAEPAATTPSIDGAESIKRRIEKRKAQKSHSSFPVAVIVTCKIKSFSDIKPYVRTAQSTEKMEVTYDEFIKQVLKVRPDFPFSECIFVLGKNRIYNSSTIHTLGVRQNSPSLRIQAMLKDEYERMTAAEFEEQMKKFEEEDAASNIESIIQNQVELIRQKEAQAAATNNNQTQGSSGSREESVENSEGYFKIKLLGSDNHPISVKVKSDTQIIKLAEYFCKQKKLPPKTVKKVRLVFDDEDIDISGTVGDTELEEGFTVEVHVS